MARCRYCNSSGLSLMTNDRGLCKTCDKKISFDVKKKLADIKHSLVYIRCSMNPDIQASYCSMATSIVEKLVDYDKRRLIEINPSPAAMLVMLQTKMEEAMSLIGNGNKDGSSNDEPEPADTSSRTAPSNGEAAPIPDASAVGIDNLANDVFRPGDEEGQDWWAWQPSEADPQGTDAKDRERAGCSRKSERIPIDCVAVLDPGAIRGTLQNISSGGAFLQTEKLQSPGSLVDLVINTDHGPSKAQGIVRWVRIDSLSGESPGMGIEFTEVTEVLRSFLQSRFDFATSPAGERAFL